jgi:glutamate-1-semialdehyde 2,1-aminomutase
MHSNKLLIICMLIVRTFTVKGNRCTIWMIMSITMHTHAMQRRAEERIPGTTQLLSKQPDRFAPGAWPGYFSRAKGAFIWDLDDNKYIDMSIGGIGANVLGYADHDVDAAVKQAIDHGSSSSLNCAEEVELADRLIELHPWATHVRFARSGGEAMAIAVRIARAVTGKDLVAFCGYHGWHDWYLAANLGQDSLGGHLMGGLDPLGVPRSLKGTAFPFHYNSLEELDRILSVYGKQVGVIVMEPLRGEYPRDDFLQRVRARATQRGIPLIFDEVSAGFRLNTGGAHLTLDVEPDVAVFSKAMGNGYPIAAIIGRDDVMQYAARSFISSTMWTERIGPTAALATIHKHERLRVGDHLIHIGRLVQAAWRDASAAHGLSIRVSGLPPISHFSFFHEDSQALKALFVTEMLNRGFLASTDFYSMYAHTEEHVTAYTTACYDVFGVLAEACAADDVQSRLRGGPATTGFTRFA